MTRAVTRRVPRSPSRTQCRDVGAWLRYYERMQRWYLDSARLLNDHPDSQEHCLSNAARFGRGVTEILIGAHCMQLTGQWS